MSRTRLSVTLPSELVRQVKHFAIEADTTVSQVVEDALRRELGVLDGR